jgi:hypothetical protein
MILEGGAPDAPGGVLEWAVPSYPPCLVLVVVVSRAGSGKIARPSVRTAGVRTFLKLGYCSFSYRAKHARAK